MDATRALAAILADLEKKYGVGSASLLAQSKAAEVQEVIPTGIEVLDRYVLGCGGLPVGRMSEVYGMESSGKSSLVMSCIASVQRIGGLAILCDAEHAFVESRARLFGVDPEKVLMIDPPHLQGGGNMIISALSRMPDDGPPVLVALDSIPALITREETEGEAGDEYIGLRARYYSKFCTYLVKLLPKKRAHMLFINQVRMKIGVMFGNPETTPGGNAIKFYSSIRLRMRRGKASDEGLQIYAKCVKNKVSEPDREVETRIIYGAAFDTAWTTVAHAKDLGVVSRETRATEAGLEKARVALGWASGAVEASSPVVEPEERKESGTKEEPEKRKRGRPRKLTGRKG